MGELDPVHNYHNKNEHAVEETHGFGTMKLLAPYLTSETIDPVKRAISLAVCHCMLCQQAEIDGSNLIAILVQGSE